MVKKVRAWILSVYAAHAWANLLPRIKRFEGAKAEAKVALAELEVWKQKLPGLIDKAEAKAKAKSSKDSPGAYYETAVVRFSQKEPQKLSVSITVETYMGEVRAYRVRVSAGFRRRPLDREYDPSEKAILPEAIWAHLQSHITGLQAELHGKSIFEEGNLGQDEKERWVELRRLVQELKKYASGPKAYKSKATAKFGLDLSGWKYISPRELDLKEDWIKRYEMIVELIFKPRKTIAGQWFQMGRKLQVDVRSAPVSVDGWKNAVARLDEILIHELSHMGQSVAQYVMGAKGFGLPSPGLQEELFDPSGFRRQGPRRTRQDHPLRDVEFYTNLRDAISSFKRFIRKVSPADRADAARIWVGEDPVDFTGAEHQEWKQRVPRTFWTPDSDLKALRQRRPDKWKKAVAEFYKGVAAVLS
jgi:hypothetical protein